MATKIKVIRAREILKATMGGNLDLSESCQMLADVAKARRSPADFHILLDLRGAHWQLSTMDIYEFASTLAEYNDFRGSKIAILTRSGIDFKNAEFLETCSVNRGMNVDSFTNFEDAITWFFDPPNAS